MDSCFHPGCYTCLLPPTNEVFGKVMFLHLSVILFTRWGEGGVSQHAMGMRCVSQHAMGQWCGRHPLGRKPLGKTPQPTEKQPLKQAVRILLECILVYCYFDTPHRGILNATCKFCNVNISVTSFQWSSTMKKLERFNNKWFTRYILD